MPAHAKTAFVAQLPVQRLGPPLGPVGEGVFRPVMKYVDGRKFELELDAKQVEQLVVRLVEAQKHAQPQQPSPQPQRPPQQPQAEEEEAAYVPSRDEVERRRLREARFGGKS